MEFQDGSGDALLDQEDGKVRDPRINLDKFFCDMYQYYKAQGIGAIILSELCGVLTLGFTVCFSVFLLAFVDWAGLLSCHDEDSCKGVNDALIRDPFQQTPTMFTFFIFTYFVLFCGMWIWKCISAMGAISDALEMSTFFGDKLGIKLVELQYLQWYEVVDRLALLHEHGAFRVSSKAKVTVHDVALRIMRKENYLIGLINKNALDLFVPWWLSPIASEQLFLTQSLEWSLSFCIMDYMFNDSFDISADFLHDVAGLQWRFQVVGLIHFLLLPFMLIYMTVHFFLQNAQQFHSSKAYLGPRQWSPLALWKFREFNELPHIFEERINRSYAPANDYILTFHNPYTTILASCTTYITGAFIATLLLVSVLSDGALLYVHIADYNLLWYLGVFSACYAAARSQIPDETKAQESAETLLKRTCAHTHYFPEAWEQRADSVDVKNEVCEVFQYKAQIFAMEVLSVVLTPAVLCFSLPVCAPAVLAFIREHSRYIEGIGAVCDYSLFDFERYGDEDFGAQKSGFVEQVHRPNDGKMEKSFVNFQQHNPNFDGGAAAKTLFARLNAYKDGKRQQRDQALASVMEKSMLFASHNFAGTGAQSDTPEASSPIVHRNRFSATALSEEAPGSYREESPALPPQGLHDVHGMQGLRINASQGSDEGGFANPTGFAMSVMNPASMPKPGAPPLRVTPQVVNSSDLHLFSPNAGQDSSLDGGGGFRSRVHSSGGGEETYSEVGDAMSPLIHDNRLRPDSTAKGNRRAPAFAPSAHFDMSNMSALRASTQHLSASRAFPHHGSRSLFESNYGSRRSALRGQPHQQSREDLPSVLLSIMRQENIDYENDFYWMAQFHAERRRDPAGVERSILDASALGLGRPGRASRNVSGGSEMRSFLSPLQRQYSHTSPPPFAAHPDGAPFSPGLAASGMDSPRGAGAFYTMPPHPEDSMSFDDTQQGHPQYQYEHNGNASDEGVNWRQVSASSAASGGAFRHQPPFRVAGAQKKSGSSLGRLAESDMEG